MIPHDDALGVVAQVPYSAREENVGLGSSQPSACIYRATVPDVRRIVYSPRYDKGHRMTTCDCDADVRCLLDTATQKDASLTRTELREALEPFTAAFVTQLSELRSQVIKQV